MSFTVRLLADCPSAARAVAHMVFSEWPALYPAWGQHSATDVEAALLRDNTGAGGFPFTLVALDDAGGGVLGSVGLEESDLVPRDARRPWVVAMLVDAPARGRGVANALLRALVLRAAELGFARLHLWTHDQQAWYMRHGWELASEGDAFGQHAYFLELDVARGAALYGGCGDGGTA